MKKTENKTMTSRPETKEYTPYYSRYIDQVQEADVLSVLKSQVNETDSLTAAFTSQQELYRYAPGKWSVREVFGHLIDGERIFGHRIFCISRGERAPFPSFDQNDYIAASRYNERPVADLVAEFATVRKINLTCLENLAESDWKRTGTVNGNTVTVRALAFILAGHVRHHLNGLRTNYGVASAT